MASGRCPQPTVHTTCHALTGTLLPSCCRLLTLAAFASVAAHLQAEDAIQHSLLPRGVTLQQLAEQHLRPLLPAQLAAWLEAAGRAALPALAAAPAAAQLGAHLVAMPLASLLPHATFALCAVLAALWLAQAASGQLRGAAAATACAQLLLAALLQVSDRQAPLILLLALLEMAALSRLLARRAGLLPAGGAAAVAGEAGALLALVAAQLFYVTGHLCEFAGLQYTAGRDGLLVGASSSCAFTGGCLPARSAEQARLPQCGSAFRHGRCRRHLLPPCALPHAQGLWAGRSSTCGGRAP